MNLLVLRKVLMALMPVFVEMTLLVISEIMETSTKHSNGTEDKKEARNHEAR